jgi:hypothetical protein
MFRGNWSRQTKMGTTVRWQYQSCILIAEESEKNRRWLLWFWKPDLFLCILYLTVPDMACEKTEKSLGVPGFAFTRPDFIIVPSLMGYGMYWFRTVWNCSTIVLNYLMLFYIIHNILFALSFGCNGVWLNWKDFRFEWKHDFCFWVCSYLKVLFYFHKIRVFSILAPCSFTSQL